MTFGASVFLAHYLDSAHEKERCLGNLILAGDLNTKYSLQQDL